MVIMAMIRVAMTASGNCVLPPRDRSVHFSWWSTTLDGSEIRQTHQLRLVVFPYCLGGSFTSQVQDFFHQVYFLSSLASLEEIIIPFLPKQSRVSLRYLYGIFTSKNWVDKIIVQDEWLTTCTSVAASSFRFFWYTISS